MPVISGDSLVLHHLQTHQILGLRILGQKILDVESWDENLGTENLGTENLWTESWDWESRYRESWDWESWNWESWDKILGLRVLGLRTLGKRIWDRESFDCESWNRIFGFRISVLGWKSWDWEKLNAAIVWTWLLKNFFLNCQTCDLSGKSTQFTRHPYSWPWSWCYFDFNCWDINRIVHSGCLPKCRFRKYHSCCFFHENILFVLLNAVVNKILFIVFLDENISFALVSECCHQ